MCSSDYELQKMVSDKELDKVLPILIWRFYKRDVVRYALMKVACGYHNGHTSQCIINELGLCSKDLILTKKEKSICMNLSYTALIISITHNSFKYV
jgi:hypothetical protein